MPVSLLTFSSTVTVADAKPKRNKLRRRRHSYASRPGAMAVVASNDAEHAAKEESVVSGSDTTLLDQERDLGSVKGSNINEIRHEVHDSPHVKDPTYDDAQAQVIASLRSQISDLLTQVTQLNGKLVNSYDRVSDLEDELHVASSNLRSNSIKISQLELERTQHLAALNTGLLVEKSHVTSELTRLMERATDEAARRGQAETARANIEKDLDDLSANLFDQANRMVAEARLEKAMCERKAVDAEMALKSAEEVVSLMQVQMQAMREDKDRSTEEIENMRALMGKGKYVEHPPVASQISVKLLSVHTPYQEFLLFVAHLRSIRPATTHPPSINTFLPLPFLARLATEDSDPTVRLDIAPSLNWLSRRSVLSAIYTGQLTIEPMSATNLLLETTTSSLQSMIPGSNHTVSCALCGTHIFPDKPDSAHPPPHHPLSSLSFSRPTTGISGSATWSSSIFKNPLSSNTSAAPSPPLTPPPNVTTHSAANGPDAKPTTVYVFSLAQTQTPTHPAQQQKPQDYPLCNSGWCLARLRTTCSLWAFIRAGVIDRIWEEESPTPTRQMLTNGKHTSMFGINASSTSLSSSTGSVPEKDRAPPLPPRRRSKMSSVGASVGSLWGMASSALKSQPQSPVKQQEKETSKPGTPTKQQEKETPKPDAPVKTDSNIRGLSVTVPPPLPRRSMGRSISQSKSDEKTVQDVPEVPPLPAEARESEEAKEETKASLAIPESKSPSPKPGATGVQLSHTSSQSSLPSATDEFSTPVEEFGPPNLPPVPPVTAPLSPSRRRSASRSPPVSPLRPTHSRTSSRTPPPLPLSPKSVPLPDSRPGSPLQLRSRPTSTTVGGMHAQSLQVQLQEAEENANMNEKLPSRTASPAPIGLGGAGAAAAPPPLPRRAAARRAAPVPPGGAATPARPATPVREQPVVAEEKEKEKKEEPATEKRTSNPLLPPPPPPRRTAHVVHPSVTKLNGVTSNDTVSVSDYGDSDDKTEVQVPVPVRLNREGLQLKHETDARVESPSVTPQNGDGNGTPEDDPLGTYVGSATWEERTWKEITRLREDMFWARIGAVRN